MQPKRIAELKRRVDEALEGGELSVEAQATLVDVLTPDPHEQTWPHVEVVLHVAEHPVVAVEIRRRGLPEGLETALVEAFSAVLPMLGIRVFGPLTKFVERTRRRLDLERRKYELVEERLGAGRSREEEVRLLRNYISTEPAPLFLARLRQAHTKLVAEATRQSEQGLDLEVLVEHDGLAAALADPRQSELDAPAVRAALEALRDHPEVSQVTLRRGLMQGSTEQRLVAGAVAAIDIQTDLSPLLLGLVTAGVDCAAPLSVMAARLSPMMARNVYAQFLAEAAWQNPEEPEARITAERTHAILAARCMLPKIGSPLSPVSRDDVPESVEYDALRDIPEIIDACWALWEELM